MKYYSKLLATALLASTSMTTYAQYLIIGSDSNNCQLHTSSSGKSYVTGYDCLCMKKSEQTKHMQWVISFGGKDKPLGCYPELDLSANHHYPIQRPNDCKEGDHCSQYDCLELLYDDNKPQAENEMTVTAKQCVEQDGTSLDFCDENGHQCGDMPHLTSVR